MVVRLRRVPAEEHIAVIVNGLNSHSRLFQQVGRVPAPRAPEGIVDHLDARLGDGLQVDKFLQPLQKRWLHVRRLEPALGNIPVCNARPIAESANRRLNLPGHLRQRRRSVVR
jgi:hypothetical protein